MKDKKIFFLVSLPRAGNTILGSLINQNPNFACTAHSVVPDIVENLNLIKTKDTFKNFPDYNSFNNVVENVYKNYYQDNYPNFRDDWTKKSFYYKNVVRTGSHFFYFAPSKYQETFTVMQLKENIFILKRTDSNLGWTLDVHIDTIHICSGQKKTIHVGSSNENEKVFIIE